MLRYSQEQYPKNAFHLSAYASRLRVGMQGGCLRSMTIKKLLESMEDNMFSARK